MRFSFWQTGLVIGTILLVLGLVIEQPFDEIATDTSLIFGIIVTVFSIGVAIGSLVRRK